MSLKPPLLGMPALMVFGAGAGEGAGPGAAPGWLPPKCLTAFQASSARIAIVIGDMPPPESVADLEGPRGPFCMPFNTSSKPMVGSRKLHCPAAKKITVPHDGYKARAGSALR